MKAVEAPQFESIPLAQKIWHLNHRGKVETYESEFLAGIGLGRLQNCEKAFEALVNSTYFWKFRAAVRSRITDGDDYLPDAFPTEFVADREDEIFWMLKNAGLLTSYNIVSEYKRFYDETDDSFYDTLEECQGNIQDYIDDGDDLIEETVIDLDTNEKYIIRVVCRRTYETTVEKQ